MAPAPDLDDLGLGEEGLECFMSVNSFLIVWYCKEVAEARHANDLALQALDGHLDRMDDATTNSGTALSQLTDANACLASAR